MIAERVGRAGRRGLCLLLLGASTAGLSQGCQDDVIVDCQCGLVCPSESVADGNANISGTQSIDAFFAAVIDYERTAADLRAEVDLELQALARSLGLPPAATAAEIRTALDLRLADATEGLGLHAGPSRCRVSTQAALAAALRCDPTLAPDAVSVACEGVCIPDAQACDAGARVTCRGVARARAPARACSRPPPRARGPAAAIARARAPSATSRAAARVAARGPARAPAPSRTAPAPAPATGSAPSTRSRAAARRTRRLLVRPRPASRVPASARARCA